MQLRTMAWRRVALSALGMIGASCSDLDLTCRGDQDCLDSELCHPDEQVCVWRCTTDLSCLPTRPKCQALSDSNTTKICQA